MSGSGDALSIVSCLKFYLTAYGIVPLCMLLTAYSFRYEYYMLYDQVQVE